MPLSAVMVSEKVWQVLRTGGDRFGVFGHGYTYTAHPIAAAAALANLRIIEDERLVERAAVNGAFLHERLREAFADHPLVGEVRGFGLIGAVEFVAERKPATRFDPALKVGARVAKAARERGLITRALPLSDSIAFSPPLVISQDELAEAVTRARAAVDAVADHLVRDGTWTR